VSANVQILGSSSAVPNPAEATSAYLIRDAEVSVLLECGHGAVGRLRQYVDATALDAVVVSHMHPDHCMDLVALRNYRYVRSLPALRLYLPRNGPSVLRNVAVALELAPDYFDHAFDVRTYDSANEIRIHGLSMSAIRTRHNTLGYALKLVTSNAGCLLFTSDTGWYAELSQFARGADVLLVEVTDHVTPATDERWHLCPRDAARLIESARPGKAILTHYVAEHSSDILDAVANACPDTQVELAVAGEVHRVGR
jgi:ribonuclease BN (tRNA processing enzyme)